MATTTAAIALPVRGSALHRLWERQDPHSVFLAAAGLLLAATLVFDLLLHRETMKPWVLWLLLVFTLGLAAVALLVGRRVPVMFGLSCVVVFALASFYFLGPWSDVQASVSTAQELPILALYLGWFVPRPLGRIVMLVSLALFLISVVLNPIFRHDGMLGVPTAVQMLVIALFCFEIGSVLWRKSERQITTDPLTGALNRAGFLKRLDRKLKQSFRSQAPFCLVVVDFDRFKQLNDTHGHAAGDRALVETVAKWREGVRSYDLIGRTGGDEFALLLDRVDATEAQAIMTRLRADSPHAWSWGIAQVREGDEVEALFARADRLLYAAKEKRG